MLALEKMLLNIYVQVRGLKGSRLKFVYRDWSSNPIVCQITVASS